MSDSKNAGHGHVYPRPDGVKARCGGPALCSQCARELAMMQNGSHSRFEEAMAEKAKQKATERLESRPALKLSTLPPNKEPNWFEIKRELSRLINIHSLDVHQGTPDFMLADFMVRTLRLHREFVIERNRWFEGVTV